MEVIMILQKNYSSTEPQFMCDVCSEAVINPLCPFCLTLEVEAWLTLYPDLKHELLPKIKKYLSSKVYNLSTPFTKCIKCKHHSAFICPYCFTEHVLIFLKDSNTNKIVLKEFFEFFNFDFDHNGYTIEAEKLGVV
jgi:hypothetical protein